VFADRSRQPLLRGRAGSSFSKIRPGRASTTHRQISARVGTGDIFQGNGETGLHLPFAHEIIMLKKYAEIPGTGVTNKDLTAKRQAFIARCKGARLKVTPQRMIIYETLLQDGTHPSPERLYRSIRRRHPTISPATVYTTLETFERHGIIARLTPLHDTVRFDPMLEPHHHTVCVRCKKVSNLWSPEFSSLVIPKALKRENAVLGYSVYVNVLCAACRKSVRGRR